MSTVYAGIGPEDLAGSVNAARLRGDLAAFVGCGSRVVGYPGNQQAGDYVLSAFQRLGLETMIQRFNLPTPLDKGASLRIGERTFPLACIWPDLVRTPQLPPQGCTGDIIYVRQGRLSDYNGRDVRGSIVLIDFNTQQNWLTAPLLDAAAVIFLEPANTTRGEAEMKFLRCPVNVPRFYVGGKDADSILAAAAAGEARGKITAAMPWANAANRNIIGILPGRDPELSKQAVILQAYYDSISMVPRVSPGAENAVSIATLLEMARILKATPPARTVIFLATSGHFQAFAGAREFARMWGREPRREAQRYDRLNEHQRDLAELQALKAQVEADIARVKQQGPGAPPTGAAQGPTVLVGQLPLSLRAAEERAKRLDDEVANAQNDIAIWKRLDQFTRVQMFCGLDLSSHNPAIGVFQVGGYYNQSQLLRFYSPVGKQFADWVNDVAPRLGQVPGDVFVDGINPVKGREWFTFFPGKIGFDHEMVIRGGRPGIVLATVNDARPLCDTPLDTLERLDMNNVVNQARLLTCLVYKFLDDPGLSTGALKRVEALKKMDDLEDVRGTVLEFRRRESFVPNTVVPNALVLVQGPSRMMMGVHTEVMQFGNETSEFKINGTTEGGGMLEAYAFDPSTGDICYAPDMGQDGDKKYPRDVLGRSGLKRPVVVFRCVSTDIFDLIDERYFQTLGRMFVYNAKDNSEPISFGYSLAAGAGAGSELPSYVEPCSVIYAPGDVDLQVTMGMGLLGVRMVLINATDRNPLGEGYRAAYTPRIPYTDLRIAHDMWTIDESRMSKLRKYGITNARLDELHTLARAALDASAKALSERRYDVALADARHAWGYESRAYPDVKSTQIDVIKGVLFYLAILLPFAYFGERLLIAARTIVAQIFGTLAVFAVVFVALAAVHPAFALTQAPPIILLAFIIMALAVLVIAIVTQKFNQELKAMKQSRGGVHEADVGRLSAAAAAFALGIANMRRRVARTALTAITLTLLTFTVLSFTSVVPRLKTNQLVLNTPPSYPGVMLRDRSWLPLEGPTADIISNELSPKGKVAPRAWYTSSDIEKELTIDLGLANDPTKRYTVSCILGLSPQEDQVTGIGSKALVAGRFLQAGEKNVVVVPTTVAQALGITPNDMGSAGVEMFGTTFRVVGIVDEKRMRNIVDLDGENMTPVNYALLRPEVIKELKEQAAQRSQLGTTSAQSLLQEYKHYGPEKLIILPYDRTLELGGTLRSVAVRYDDPAGVADGIEQMMKRFALSVYAGIGKETYLFSSVDTAGFKGIGEVIIPIFIAALIVLNTMLGAVYERTREIGIYSSLGLAPVHISMLFLAEASVFANMGAIIGYLLGQVIAKILFVTNATHGLELNYSSMSAVAVTIVVVAVVLLSTLYPSKKASELASPGIERRWSLPEPVGDELIVRLPFTVTGRDAWGVSAFLKEFFDEYVGYAGGEFLADNVRLEPAAGANGVYVRLRMWLAPYDLGVSQDFQLACDPTDDGDIYEILITLHRLAGDVTSWKKTNTLFLASIRKQFLIWRTVSHGEKADYADRAQRILLGEYVGPEAMV